VGLSKNLGKNRGANVRRNEKVKRFLGEKKRAQKKDMGNVVQGKKNKSLGRGIGIKVWAL